MTSSALAADNLEKTLLRAIPVTINKIKLEGVSISGPQIDFIAKEVMTMLQIQVLGMRLESLRVEMNEILGEIWKLKGCVTGELEETSGQPCCLNLEVEVGVDISGEGV